MKDYRMTKLGILVVSLTLTIVNAADGNMCLEGCTCFNQSSKRLGDHYLIDCSNLGITSVPKDLQKFKNYADPIHLSLNKNMVTRVSKADFPAGIPIIALDFSSNRGVMITDDAFINIKGLVSLKLNDVSLRFDDKMKYLSGKSSLRYLSLNKNYQFGAGLLPQALLTGLGLTTLNELLLHDCYLKGLENGAFADVDLVGNLDLGANQLDHIPDELRTLSNVQSLVLSQNSIKNIPADSFKGMDSLQLLAVSNNYISENNIDKNAFRGVDLKELQLEQSVLNTIPTEALSPLHNLKTLKLKNSPIKSVPMHSFNGSFCLQYLDLTNVLVEIERVHLNGLESCLNNLYLSNMQIREVPQFLKNFNVLEFLSLSGNSISVIRKGDFVGTTISKLSLNENPLTKIEAGAFEPFPHSISLQLSDTRLANLSFIRDYPYGTVMDVEIGNMFPDCNCDLAIADYRVLNIYGNCNLNDTGSLVINSDEFVNTMSYCWPGGQYPGKNDVWSASTDNSSNFLAPIALFNMCSVLFILLLQLLR